MVHSPDVEFPECVIVALTYGVSKDISEAGGRAFESRPGHHLNSPVSRGGYRAASFGTEDVGELRAKSEQFVVSPVGEAHMKGGSPRVQESRRS